MNKKTSIAIIIVLAILLIITSFYTIVHMLYNYSTTDWFQEKCGTSYTVIGKEIGTPLLDGKSEAQIEIYDNTRKKFILSFNTKLDNSGLPLSQDNYNIVTNNEYFSLILYDNGKNIYATYSFYYNDLINIKG